MRHTLTSKPISYFNTNLRVNPGFTLAYKLIPIEFILILVQVVRVAWV